MSLMRKTHAKYGAKIPPAPSAGAKTASQGKKAAPASPPEKAEQAASKSGNKKR